MSITISRARLYELTLPLVEPFRLSGGTMAVRRSLIVELEDGEGRVGLGESAPFEAPFYSPETVTSAREMLLQHLLPRLLAEPCSNPAQVHELLSRNVMGNRMAIAGAETAWWDLRSEREERALADLVTDRLEQLGVPPEWRERRERLRCGIALGMPENRTASEIRNAVTRAVERGYRRVKLKVMPGWDLEPIYAALDALERYDAEIPLTVDANGSYQLERDRGRLEQLGRLGLLYLEQPLPAGALWDLKVLAGQIDTPICLDESLTSADVARQVAEMGGPEVWNIKVQRIGGLEEACRICAVASKYGAKLWGGTMPETGVGAQAMLALGAHAGFVYPTDLEPSERWYAPGADPIELTMESDGTMLVPTHRPAVSRDGWELVTVVE
ncbi:MAG: o-succinylbenzoate synthase [Gemmatimonadota bacterium]|nr:MAG: o-succinylbenzoate synthase [Gemmatimonadota bacterium]